ncbi:cholesterol catabolism transcriptional regulator KstR [soil metagenome]
MAAINDTEVLTPSQAARRQKVIRAALELGAQGGYEAVQMRDVATTAGVALGTIYRYFSSKDHLLAAALVEWVADLERRVTQRPSPGATTAERVVGIIRRATRAMEKEPRLSEAVVTAILSPDAATTGCQEDVASSMTRIMGRAFGEDLPPEELAQVTKVLGHVWFSALIGWINHWQGIGQVGDEVEVAAHLILDGRGLD